MLRVPTSGASVDAPFFSVKELGKVNSRFDLNSSEFLEIQLRKKSRDRQEAFGVNHQNVPPL